MNARNLGVLSGVLLVLAGAGPDNTVEWAGITHIDWLDRTPRCPVDGESFTVRFQAYHDDLTAAGVWVNGTVRVAASRSHRRGPYDVWTATLPASPPTGTLSYVLELTDGSDTDYLGPAGMSDDPPAAGWQVDMLTARHAPPGATLVSGGGAVFKVWAPPPSWLPGGNWLAVRGDFTGWGCAPLAHDGDYIWYGRVPGVEPLDEYKYYFWDSACGQNGWDYHEDARYRRVNRADYNNSVVVDPDAYAWTLKDFTPPPFEEMVIYELHVGTFSGRNDGLNRMGRYRDVVDRHLDHLRYLGVNVVELLPVTEFDGYESWGYNPVNLWAPEESYGSPDDLKYMIDRLHQAGIAVLLDVVYNHFSGSGNYLWDYGDRAYFDRTAGGGPGCDTPWGAQAALWRQEVRDYYAQNVLYWLEEYGFDGIRMDATTYLRPPLGCYSEGWDLMRRINDELDARAADKIAIAEELPDNAWITRATAQGGAGFDSQWHDRFTDDVRQEIFDAAYGDPEMGRVRDALLGRLNDAGGTYIQDWGQSPTQLVNYVEGHDEAADARLAVRIDGGDPYSVWARGRSKLAQGLTILAPGIPMFLMGGEWLEDTPFGAGWANRIDWSKAAARPQMTLFFRDVIAVRRSNCGLRSDAPCSVYHVNDTGNVLAFSRGLGQELVVVANFSNTDYTAYSLWFPADGTWYELLNSQAAEYAGNGLGNGGAVTVTGGWATLTVPRMGLLVLRHADAPGRSPDLDGDGDADLRDYAHLQRAAAARGCGLPADIREDGRVDGLDLVAFLAAVAGPD